MNGRRSAPAVRWAVAAGLASLSAGSPLSSQAPVSVPVAIGLDHIPVAVGNLEANQANLDRSIRLVAPFVRVFANTTGNGRWFDTYIQNLVPVPGGPGSPS